MSLNEEKSIRDILAQQKKLAEQIRAIKSETTETTEEQLKILKELQNEYKKLEKDRAKADASRLRALSQAEDANNSLSGIYKNLSALEEKRIEQTVWANGLTDQQRESINNIADKNRELAQLTSGQGLMRNSIQEEIHAEMQNLEGVQGVHAHIRKNLRDQTTEAIRMSNLTEREKKAAEQVLDIQEKIRGVGRGILETFQTLVSGPMGALGTSLIGAGFVLDHLGHVAHETGTFFTEMSLSAAGLGFVFKDATNVAMGLASEFGSIEEATFGIQLKTNMIAQNMGLGGEAAASLVGSFARLNEGSADSALDMMQFTQNLAKANNVAPTKVMQDIAGSAEAFAKYGKAGGENIAIAAVSAAKLGVSMSTLEGISDNLLDFESSITKELELSAMLGRNINLNRARALAYQGELGAATKETLKQLGGVDAFNRMDVFQKKQSADLLGISVAELQKMADNYNRLNDDGSIQLTNAEAVGAKFDMWAQSLKGIATGPGGGFLKMLGSAAIAAGQMGFNFADMTKNLRNKAWKAAQGIFGMGGASKSVASDVVQNKPGGAPGKENPIDKFKQVSGDKKGFNATNMIKGAAAILILAGALWVASKAFQEFATVKFEDVMLGIGAISALAGVAYVLGKAQGEMVKGAFAVALLGAALIPFAFAMNMMKDVGSDAIYNAVGGILLLGLAAATLGVASAFIFTGALVIAALGAASLVAGAGIMVLAMGMERLFASFSNIGSIVEQLTPLVTMVGPIFALAGAITSLALAMAFLGVAGLPGLAVLAGISALVVPLATIANLLGFGSDDTGAVEKESLSEYQTQMLSKMDKLIEEVAKNRDVYLDREKVTNAVVKSSERKTENIWGLGVA